LFCFDGRILVKIFSISFSNAHRAIQAPTPL
jgi:hypothetical protein